MRQAFLAVVALAVTLSVPGAQADETPNAVYVGTASGGGTVEFRVTAAGTAVDFIELTGLPGTGCGDLQIWPRNLPIVNHAFSFEEPPSFFRGAFGAGDTASGTLRWANGCVTGVLTWTATVAVPPPPIPPPFHPPYCHVPKVVGKTLAAARQKLASGHCRRVRVTKARSPKARRGRVLSQRPRTGAWLPGFGWVFLVVGRGPGR